MRPRNPITTTERPQSHSPKQKPNHKSIINLKQRPNHKFIISLNQRPSHKVITKDSINLSIIRVRTNLSIMLQPQLPARTVSHS
jgi:hypothetical protein